MRQKNSKRNGHDSHKTDTVEFIDTHNKYMANCNIVQSNGQKDPGNEESSVTLTIPPVREFSDVIQKEKLSRSVLMIQDLSEKSIPKQETQPIGSLRFNEITEGIPGGIQKSCSERLKSSRSPLENQIYKHTDSRATHDEQHPYNDGGFSKKNHFSPSYSFIVYIFGAKSNSFMIKTATKDDFEEGITRNCSLSYRNPRSPSIKKKLNLRSKELIFIRKTSSDLEYMKICEDPMNTGSNYFSRSTIPFESVETS